MQASKIAEYRKSIKFELIRAEIAFDEFFCFAGGFITGKFDDNNVPAKIKIFDAYARWIGHLYESLLALVKIEEMNSVSEDSRSEVTDSEIQFEAQKSLNRFNALVKSGRVDPNGRISPTLNNDFSFDLRVVRNKCAFHCTSNRVQSDLLQEFMNNHHHMAYWLYSEMLGLHGRLGSECDQDLGAINQFFSAGRRALSLEKH